jgi:hypothetical protein
MPAHAGSQHQTEVSTMTKERSPKKEGKKKPAHSLKEKRAAKKSKNEGGSPLGSGKPQ